MNNGNYNNDNATKETQDTVEIEKEVKEKYGINLELMEQIVLHNGKQYFKLYDPRLDTYRMIENTNNSKNLSEQFKEIQQVLASSQTNNEKSNAESIYQSEAKYQRKELSMIPVGELESNLFRLNGMDSKKRKCVTYLIKFVNYARNNGSNPIRFINFEDAFAIDSTGQVISAEYNNNYTNKQDEVLLFRSLTMKFNTKDEASVDSKENVDLDIPDEYFDKIVENIDMSDDNPVIVEGEEISKAELENYYNYPEMIDKDETMTKKRKYIIVKFISALSRKKQVMTNQKANQKIFQLNNRNHQNRQAAFVNNLVIAILAGIIIGVILTLFLTFFKV